MLIVLSGATTGKLAVFQLQEKAVLNQRVGRFRWVSEKLIDKHFFTFFLDMLSHYILIEAYGGAQPNISPTRIEQMATILPPLAEQKRIVAKVDQLLARVNAARERLTRVAAILAGAEKHVAAATAQTDKLTQAILAKAFRGELVPTEAELALREGRSYEPASALLAKIEAQRNHVRPQRKRRSSWQQKSS